MSTRAKVAVLPCSTYAAGLRQVLDELMRELGGLKAYVKPAQSVLIKPNLLTDRVPEQAVTTHPEIVRALIRMVREAGANPVVADSPANAVKLERVWDRTGMGRVCAEEQAPLVNLEEAGSVRMEEGGFSFSIAKPVLDADVIINAPKVKTHSLTILTAGVKNVYGMVPGFQKTHLHKYHPTQKEFGRLLKAIYGKVKPALTIADAIVGMEGNGPTAGEPTHLNFLAAADSGPALDLTLCHILRIRPKLVSYLDGSSASDRESIEILGCDLKDVSPRSFRLPNTVYPRLIPGRLAKALGRLLWIRPVVSDACTRCGRCVRSCPAEALSMPPDGPPRLDAVRCIGCCCCHEICPSNAITMAMSPVLRFIRKGKLP